MLTLPYTSVGSGVAMKSSRAKPIGLEDAVDGRGWEKGLLEPLASFAVRFVGWLVG